MKNFFQLLALALLLLLVIIYLSCSKQPTRPILSNQVGQTCLVREVPSSVSMNRIKRKRVERLVYLDFSNTSLLSDVDKRFIQDSLNEVYKTWMVTFTIHRKKYELFNCSLRSMVRFTDSLLYGYRTVYGYASVSSILYDQCGFEELMAPVIGVKNIYTYQWPVSHLQGVVNVTVHEFGHASGLWHQSDSCRNRYSNGKWMGWPLEVKPYWAIGLAPEGCFLQCDTCILNTNLWKRL